MWNVIVRVARLPITKSILIAVLGIVGEHLKDRE